MSPKRPTAWVLTWPRTMRAESAGNAKSSDVRMGDRAWSPHNAVRQRTVGSLYICKHVVKKGCTAAEYFSNWPSRAADTVQDTRAGHKIKGQGRVPNEVTQQDAKLSRTPSDGAHAHDDAFDDRRALAAHRAGGQSQEDGHNAVGLVGNRGGQPPDCRLRRAPKPHSTPGR